MCFTFTCGVYDFRPDFYTLYMDEPDTSGHYYGPGSPQVSYSLNITPTTFSWFLNEKYHDLLYSETSERFGLIVRSLLLTKNRSV